MEALPQIRDKSGCRESTDGAEEDNGKKGVLEQGQIMKTREEDERQQ